jgi:prepilin-type N-terminal cleavage/methylation domain-containing protein
MKNGKKQKGFSLLELMVAMAILLIVAGTVIMGMMRVTWSQSTIMNRTQVHASVRNATELMQQEIGQAGRVGSAPNLTITFGTAITANTAGTSASPTVSSGTTTLPAATTGLYVGEELVVDPNSTNEETVTLTAVTTTSITATFYNAHVAATALPALVMGGFASGIVPPTTTSTPLSSKFVFSGTGTTNTTLTDAQASDGFTLKMYGDLNGDGNMYYVVYKCAPTNAGNGTLYRYISTDVTTATSFTADQKTLLLDNLYNNPNNAPCFTYSVKEIPVASENGAPSQTFVVNVAVTLTAQTQNKDTQTGAVARETKALLNIAPRNVFDAWEWASAPSGYRRAQPMPPNLLNGGILSTTLN